MFARVYLAAALLLGTICSASALFCSQLPASEQTTQPCFLEAPSRSPLALRTSGNSLVLPCHVANAKRVAVEWWYTDSQKLANYKIYPVYPPVRPTVLRFLTSNAPPGRAANESELLDASILLRHVNVDDSGVYRCVIRPAEQAEPGESPPAGDEANWATLSYQVRSTAPRLCQASAGSRPCFAAMRTSSPTVLDAYHTAFLPCVVKNHQHSGNVFWVVGDGAENNVVITDHLNTNQHGGDRLRRVFPLSPFDHSLELTVNRTLPERVYSCVLTGTNERETTLFTYIVRSIDSADQHARNATERLAPHDTLNWKQVQTLHEQQRVEQQEQAERSGEDSEETTAAY